MSTEHHIAFATSMYIGTCARSEPQGNRSDISISGYASMRCIMVLTVTTAISMLSRRAFVDTIIARWLSLVTFLCRVCLPYHETCIRSSWLQSRSWFWVCTPHLPFQAQPLEHRKMLHAIFLIWPQPNSATSMMLRATSTRNWFLKQLSRLPLPNTAIQLTG